MDYLKILKQKGFRFDKAYGQNFITDTNLLRSIVGDAGIVAGDTVLEIGTGAGTLTREIAAVAGSVVTVEIDQNLRDIHSTTIGDIEGLRIVYGDFLKLERSELVDCANYKVVANIPYYITTPIIFALLETSPPTSITLMVQKEVAERIVAKAGTEEYSALSVIVQLYASPSIKRIVPATVFVPRPKVDSAIIHMDVGQRRDIDYKAVVRLVHCAFGMRRKTLVNNMLGTYYVGKPKLEGLLESIGLDTRVRGERLTVEQFVALSVKLKEITQ